MPYAIRILAPNPGPFTLQGTNTWIVGAEPSLVLDPGPDDPAHVDEVAAAAARVGTILLTHHHPDHAPGARLLSARTGAPVAALDPDTGEEALRDGQTIRGGGVELRVVHAPGHTPDHVVFHDPTFGALFTGDAVLGRGTSVVDPPEGDMAAYLASLARMVDLAPRVIYPGHGPTVWSARDKLGEYLEHRALRERQVLDGLRRGPSLPEELVTEIYGGYPEELHGPAARSVLAHLLKLEAEGAVARLSEDEGRFALP